MRARGRPAPASARWATGAIVGSALFASACNAAHRADTSSSTSTSATGMGGGVAEPARGAALLDVPPRDVTLDGKAISIETTAALFANWTLADDSPNEKPIFILFNGFSDDVVRAFGTGPETIAEGGALVANPASLTSLGNVVYIEPREAGYSFDRIESRAPSAADCSPQVFNEYVDAGDVLLATLTFLEAHPKLRGPIVWVGESYAGVRVTWMLSAIRGRSGFSSYADPTLDARLKAFDTSDQALGSAALPGGRKRLAGGQILLEPWLMGAAHADAIAAVCDDPSTVARVSTETGADCGALDACACAASHGRSVYNYSFTLDHQKARIREGDSAHTTRASAEALFGVPLDQIAGLDLRKSGFKCDEADDSVPSEDEIVAALGSLPKGQRWYLPYAPLQPGKETVAFTPDWRQKNLVGAAFLDNLDDVPTLITDGPFDLVVPEAALAPAIRAIVGPDTAVDDSKSDRIVIEGHAQPIAIRHYPTAGHMITMLEADAFRADVAAWLGP